MKCDNIFNTQKDSDNDRFNICPSCIKINLRCEWCDISQLVTGYSFPNHTHCVNCFDILNSIFQDDGVCSTHVLKVCGKSFADYEHFFVLTNKANRDLKKFNMQGSKKLSEDGQTMSITRGTNTQTVTKVLLTEEIWRLISTHKIILRFCEKLEYSCSKNIDSVGNYGEERHFSDFLY